MKKTAEEILDKYQSNKEYPNYYHESKIIEAMEEYALEAIKADRERVAQNAKTKYVRYDDPKANFHGEDVVDKSSILNLPIELP